MSNTDSDNEAVKASSLQPDTDGDRLESDDSSTSATSPADNQVGEVEASATGLAQDLSASQSGTGNKSAPTRRVTSAKRRSVGEARKSSELRDAERRAAQVKISLTPQEERIIADSAESPEEAEAMRAEKIAAKRRELAAVEAKSRVNQSVPVRQLSQRPSYASVHASFDFHTREAFAFLIGRERRVRDIKELDPGEFANDDGSGGDDLRPVVQHRIVGLFEAGRAVREVVQGYMAGCPYAAWYLIQIEDEMDRIRSQMIRVKEKAERLTSKATTLKIEPMTARVPAHIDLTFHVPYGFHFADLLTAYDDLIRGIKSYRIMGFITLEEFRDIERSLGTPMRHLFSLPGRWFFVGRDAVLQKTALFHAAEHRMDSLPEDVLLGKRQPRLVRSG